MPAASAGIVNKRKAIATNPGKGVMRTTESGKSPASDLRFPS